MEEKIKALGGSAFDRASAGGVLATEMTLQAAAITKTFAAKLRVTNTPRVTNLSSSAYPCTRSPLSSAHDARFPGSKRVRRFAL